MATDETADANLEGQVRTFLKRNFPQIEMHGGDATVHDCDPETGHVAVNLSGACSGCGISPMTVQAIKARLPDEIPAIDEVEVETGTVDPGSEDGEDGGGHHGGMGGHPAGGGVNYDPDAEVPDWRKND